MWQTNLYSRIACHWATNERVSFVKFLDPGLVALMQTCDCPSLPQILLSRLEAASATAAVRLDKSKYSTVERRLQLTMTTNNTVKTQARFLKEVISCSNPEAETLSCTSPGSIQQLRPQPQPQPLPFDASPAKKLNPDEATELSNRLPP